MAKKDKESNVVVNIGDEMRASLGAIRAIDELLIEAQEKDSEIGNEFEAKRKELNAKHDPNCITRAEENLKLYDAEKATKEDEGAGIGSIERLFNAAAREEEKLHNLTQNLFAIDKDHDGKVTAREAQGSLLLSKGLEYLKNNRMDNYTREELYMEALDGDKDGKVTSKEIAELAKINPGMKTEIYGLAKALEGKCITAADARQAFKEAFKDLKPFELAKNTKASEIDKAGKAEEAATQAFFGGLQNLAKTAQPITR
jgi:hypothetical protein